MSNYWFPQNYDLQLNLRFSLHFRKHSLDFCQEPRRILKILFKPGNISETDRYPHFSTSFPCEPSSSLTCSHSVQGCRLNCHGGPLLTTCSCPGAMVQGSTPPLWPRPQVQESVVDPPSASQLQNPTTSLVSVIHLPVDVMSLSTNI